MKRMLLLMVLLAMIVLHSTSQVRYKIEDKNYYCYSIEELRIISIIFKDGEEAIKLANIKQETINELRNLLQVMQRDSIIMKNTINNMILKFNKQVEITNAMKEENDNLVNNNKKLKKILYPSLGINLLLLLLLL